MINNNLVLVSGAVIYKDQKNGRRWLVVKHSEESEWEIPKVVVRKVESSVRAAIRMMGEQGGITAKVLEEVGRAGGVTTVNNKTVPQRHIFYLMNVQSYEGETIGFEEFSWLEHAKAVRKLSSKREQMMLKKAKKDLRKWEREQKKLQV